MGGVLRDDTKNGCVADNTDAGAHHGLLTDGKSLLEDEMTLATLITASKVYLMIPLIHNMTR